MARKNSQQKNGVDRSLRSHKRKGAETQSAPRGKATESKVFPQENLPNGNLSGEQCSGSTVETDNGRDEIGATQQTGKHVHSENVSDAAVRHTEQSVFSTNGFEDVSTAEALGSGDGNVPLYHAYGGLKNHYSHLGYAIKGRIQNLMENVNLSDNALVQLIKRSAPSIMKAAGEWLEARKPWLIDLKTSILGARDYARMKIELAYPVVLKWLVQFGNIMLLLMMIWLDCTLRGFDSFLRMGTTSFFSFIWCGIFSAIAMVGMLKFLFVLVVAILIGVFVGLSFALIMLAISGMVSLWFYGSFWTTTLFIALGGVSFTLSHERLALFIVTAYSIYTAWAYVGWLGLLLGLNFSFISSDALIYFLRNSKVSQTRRPNKPSEQAKGMEPQEGVFHGESSNASFPEAGGMPADRSPGTPSTSGSNSEVTSEDEIARLLNCSDHYSVLGFSRNEDIDGSLLKREYRKKAMLVHPDKNQGNEKAAEAFKKLQNAYEVLLDSLKRKAYDDELRREELLNYFRRFQTASQMHGGHGFFSSGFPRTESEGEDFLEESRRIACKRCNGFHVWVLTKKLKSRARWCQVVPPFRFAFLLPAWIYAIGADQLWCKDCQDYHQAKDGDGWLEQSSQPFLFGILQKVNAPAAYICADSKVYNATEWYICQGMRCPSNTHKPSFHVNTSLTSSFSSSSSSSSKQQQHNFNNSGKGQKGGGGRGGAAVEETMMTEEEFVEWLQNAVQSGVFDNNFGGTTSSSAASATATAKGGGSSGSNSSIKKKKKGKKQW